MILPLIGFGALQLSFLLPTDERIIDCISRLFNLLLEFKVTLIEVKFHLNLNPHLT